MNHLRLVLLCLFCVVVLPIIGAAILGHALVGSQKRALRMAIGIDQVGNAAIGGSEDETISSRAGRARRDGKWWGKYAVAFIDALFWDGHCDESIGV